MSVKRRLAALEKAVVTQRVGVCRACGGKGPFRVLMVPAFAQDQPLPPLPPCPACGAPAQVLVEVVEGMDRELWGVAREMGFFRDEDLLAGGVAAG